MTSARLVARTVAFQRTGRSRAAGSTPVLRRTIAGGSRSEIDRVCTGHRGGRCLAEHRSTQGGSYAAGDDGGSGRRARGDRQVLGVGPRVRDHHAARRDPHRRVAGSHGPGRRGAVRHPALRRRDLPAGDGLHRRRRGPPRGVRVDRDLLDPRRDPVPAAPLPDRGRARADPRDRLGHRRRHGLLRRGLHQGDAATRVDDLHGGPGFRRRARRADAARDLARDARVGARGSG